jgi:hypothetical protein
MTGDVEVQNSATAMFNHKEAIQNFEGQCRHGEEIHRNDCLTMISEKSKPPLAGIAAAPESLQISGDGALGDFEPELQQIHRGSSVRPSLNFPPPWYG